MNNIEKVRQIKTNSFVTLDDEAALMISKQNNLGYKPIQYSVVDRTELVIRAQNNNVLVRFYFIKLESNLGSPTLMIKQVDNDFEARVLNKPDDFSPGDRKELLQRNILWIFQKPDIELTDNIEYGDIGFGSNSKSYFSYNDLIYTESFTIGETNYHKKQQGDLNGEINGDAGILGTLAEYVSMEQTSNEQAIILEIGPQESDTGGLLQLLVGRSIRMNNVRL